jgi:hypothetical protein
MSVSAGISVPADDFLLGRTLTSESDIRLEMVQMVPLDNRLMPYLWASRADSCGVEATVRSNPEVEDAEVLEHIDGEALIRIEWNSDMNELVGLLAVSGVALTRAVGTGESWSLQIRFSDQDRLSAFYRRCVEDDIALSIKSVHHPGWSRVKELPLTDGQREALLAAFEAGYFEIPRRTTLVELADELGVSDAALSERLRRGLWTLVRKSVEVSATSSKDTRHPSRD